ncbi:uncharacterized protein LOC143264892 [Megachile rotundata]|uniref:uncharacterized protein LOC143264892 n=1 Tax=Megachile rotundata TaxID=143995 RepID=UPI003FD5FBE5
MIMINLYIAGLFRIASYYFEKAVLAESVASYHLRSCTNNETVSYLAIGVLVHGRALQRLHEGSEKVKVTYSILTLLGMINVSISLFCLSVTVLQLSDIRETLFSATVLIATLGYIFWLNFTVEYMIESASSISLTTYSTNWYETSITTQKLLQMIILKSNKSVSFSFFSIISPSIANFAVVLKAAVSYFTVLLSLQ